MKCPDCDGEGQGQNCNEGYCSQAPECGCEDECERCDGTGEVPGPHIRTPHDVPARRSWEDDQIVV